MLAYGRFIFQDEIFEGNFEIRGGLIIYDGLKFNINEVKFLPPVKPEKIIGVGLNYRDHAEELMMEVPPEPILFMKSPSSIIGDKDTIILPDVGRVDYEGELAVVISRKCKNVSREEAAEYIAGYTCFNDVTARDLQKKWQWCIVKSFDTFSPIGPYIVKTNPSNLRIRTYLNGRIVQESTTANLIFDVFDLVSFTSSIMTLKKDDVIATGTPAGVGRLHPGDVVTVEIENIGKLTNYVR
uniref:FAA hydrolase family protein n=1 Tax=Geoglobus ahangari TaxID=113653 RepID=A0A7C4S4W5_9EURY